MSDPYVGKLTYFRGLLGHARSRAAPSQRDQGQEGAHRPHPRRCTPTTARTRTPSSPATSSPPSGSRTPPPATRSATPATRSCSSAWSSPSRSSPSPSSRRPRSTRTSWARRSASLSEEDPTFQVRTDDETGQTIISGMGELHLEVLVDRMMREFSVDANVGKPQVAYRETITEPVEKIEERYVRQTGGRGQYGHVVIDARAHRPRRRLRVRRQDHRRRDPAGVHPRGRRRHPGGDGGRRPRRIPPRRRPRHPHLRLRTTTSTRREMAFKIAGSMAFKKAARKAKPVLLEPIMAVEVVTPEDYMGDVIGDLIVPARPGRGHGAARHLARGTGPGAARRDVRLRYRPPFAHPGSRDVHHAVRLVPAGAGVDRRRNRQARFAASNDVTVTSQGS